MCVREEGLLWTLVLTRFMGGRETWVALELGPCEGPRQWAFHEDHKALVNFHDAKFLFI